MQLDLLLQNSMMPVILRRHGHRAIALDLHVLVARSPVAMMHRRVVEDGRRQASGGLDQQRQPELRVERTRCMYMDACVCRELLYFAQRVRKKIAISLARGERLIISASSRVLPLN